MTHEHLRLVTGGGENSRPEPPVQQHQHPVRENEPWPRNIEMVTLNPNPNHTDPTPPADTINEPEERISFTNSRTGAPPQLRLRDDPEQVIVPKN